MNETKETKALSKSLKTFFGVGDFGFTFMTSIDTYYASYFFTNIAMFSLSATTIMTTVSAITDAVLSVLYGPWLNKIRPKKWGRYRSWLILTPWMVPFLYAMQFVKLGDGVAAAIFCTVAMITSRIAWNIPYIANISMINVAAKNQTDRMALSSTRMVWSSLSTIAYSYVGPAAVTLFAGVLGQQNAYAATAFAFACIMFAGFFAHFKMFDGYEMTGEEENAIMEARAKEAAASASKPKVKVMDVFKSNSHFTFLMLGSMMKYVVMFLVSGFAAYYFTYVGQDGGMMVRFLLIGNILAVIAAYSSKHIVAKFTAKNTVVACYVLMAVLSLVSFVFYKNANIVLIIMSVYMFAQRVTNACEPELYAKCAVLSGKKLGYDVTGTVMGMLTVPLKIGIVTRGLLIAAVLSAVNFDPKMDVSLVTAEFQRGISVGFLIIPAVVVLVGAVILAFGYRLKDE